MSSFREKFIFKYKNNNFVSQKFRHIPETLVVKVRLLYKNRRSDLHKKILRI